MSMVSFSRKKHYPPPSPAQTQLRNLLLQYFHTIANSQKIVQGIKHTLVSHPKFNPLLLFGLVGRGKKLIGKSDWKRYLTQKNIYFSQADINFVIKYHKFKEKSNFNQFLEFLLPFTTQVLKQYNRNYINSIQIKELNPQVAQIFKQLTEYWISNIARKLINIRNQIASKGTKKKIENLIKQDIIKNSNVREAGKLREAFTSSGFKLGYKQIYKFLAAWKNGNTFLQDTILYLKRYFQSQDPIESIIPKKVKNKTLKSKKGTISFQSTPDRRTRSLSKGQQQNSFNRNQRLISSGNKYRQYKNNILTELKNVNDYGSVQHSTTVRSVKKKEPKTKQDQLRQIRYNRDRKGVNGNLIVDFFAQIAEKEPKIEEVRKKLASSENFFLINLFNVIDAKSNGFIKAKDLESFLSSQKVDCKQLVRVFAKQRKQKDVLRQIDFSNIFRPLSKKLNQALDSQPPHVLPNPFKKQTLENIQYVIKSTAELLNSLHRIKTIINNEGRNPLHLFQYIDVDNKGYILAKDIKLLVEERAGIKCEDRVQKLIMKVFGRNVEAQIGYEEFEKIIDL